MLFSSLDSLPHLFFPISTHRPAPRHPAFRRAQQPAMQPTTTTTPTNPPTTSTNTTTSHTTRSIIAPILRTTRPAVQRNGQVIITTDSSNSPPNSDPDEEVQSTSSRLDPERIRFLQVIIQLGTASPLVDGMYRILNQQSPVTNDEIEAATKANETGTFAS